MANTAFEHEAGNVRQFLSNIQSHARNGERALAESASVVLQEFETRLIESGVSSVLVTPARYALAVLIDHSARSETNIRTSTWLAAAHAHLFDRREITIDTIYKFRDTAKTEGPEFHDLAAFLESVIAELEGTRRNREGISRLPAIYLSLGTIIWIFCLGAYAAYLDYRYHSGIISSFQSEVAILPKGEPADRLGRLAELSAHVSRASVSAPLAALVKIPFWTSGPVAQKVYRDEVEAILPEAIRLAIGEALATEGEDVQQYDTLRAWHVLTGRTAWTPAYLAGWLENREETQGTASLARHVDALGHPFPTLASPDEELMSQALAFGVAATEPDRVFLELTRLEKVRSLPKWDLADAVAGLDEVLVSRSGGALPLGVPTIFTERGWAYARDIGIGVAVQTARAEAEKSFESPVETRNDTPDLVLEDLQNETLRFWNAWLADLRVRPFSDRDSAIRISGALSQRNNPLELFVQEIWTQVGGRDRRRPHNLQLRIAAEFGPAIQYVEQGKIKEISALFAALNVALGSIEFNDEQGAEKLMSVQELARSVSALGVAPPLVAQITEDVLAQTSAAHSSLLTNPLTREWQKRVYPLCQRAVEGRYPFHAGEDATLSDFEDLFGLDGAIRDFVARFAERNLDTSGETWRWKPAARLSGVGQGSAGFLQNALGISEAFFGNGGQIGAGFTLAALAERGEATIVIGGNGASVRATGASQRLAWPGPSPHLGAEVAFRQAAGSVRVAETGLWGMLRLLDTAQIRRREQGRRHLIDFRTSGGRLFFEMAFENQLNPVSVQPLVKGLACPPVL